MIRPIILVAIPASLLLGFVGWRLQHAPDGAVEVTILLDRSKSVQDPCSMLDGAAERVVQLSRGRRGSRLSLFTTGEATTAYHSVFVFSQLVPTLQRLLKDRQRVVEANKAFITEVKHVCLDRSPTLSSPIFLDIRNVMSHLLATNKSHLVEQQLFVLSDLRETYEPLIRRALQQPPGTKAKLPPPIENRNVNVLLCGFAQSRALPPLNTDRTIEIWTRLFSEAERLKFDPFCSQLTSLEGP